MENAQWESFIPLILSFNFLALFGSKVFCVVKHKKKNGITWWELSITIISAVFSFFVVQQIWSEAGKLLKGQ